MYQAQTIYPLLRSLEESEDRPLSLDQLARESGYSKWHLQRMFHQVTGQTIGSYARARRLSRAAWLLRLSRLPLVEIARRHGFDSQPAFTRAFKNQFRQTPALYRRTMKWDFHGFQPPLPLPAETPPEHAWVKLPDSVLCGISHSFASSPVQPDTPNIERLQALWHKFISPLGSMPAKAYGLTHWRPLVGSQPMHEITYSVAVEDGALGRLPDGIERIKLAGGHYIRFHFQGPAEAYTAFIRDLYRVWLPLLQIVRREGCDIARFGQLPISWQASQPVEGCYFIPVVRAGAAG